jgi:hypothetical protein
MSFGIVVIKYICRLSFLGFGCEYQVNFLLGRKGVHREAGWDGEIVPVELRDFRSFFLFGE